MKLILIAKILKTANEAEDILEQVWESDFKVKVENWVKQAPGNAGMSLEEMLGHQDTVFEAIASIVDLLNQEIPTALNLLGYLGEDEGELEETNFWDYYLPRKVARFLFEECLHRETPDAILNCFELLDMV